MAGVGTSSLPAFAVRKELLHLDLMLPDRLIQPADAAALALAAWSENRRMLGPPEPNKHYSRQDRRAVADPPSLSMGETA